MIKLITSYIRRHITLIVALVLSVCAFALVFSLYRLPVEAVLYAGALCIAVFAACGIIRFCVYLRRHESLKALERRIETELSGLPAPADAIEEDYQRILTLLDESLRASAAKLLYKTAQTQEYYTLWAHQIKTPIAAMRLMLGTGDRDAMLAAELFRIEQYVETALGFVREQSDTTDYIIRETKLDETVRAVLRKYARMFVLSRTKLEFRETGLCVLTDEKWLAFCIEQLISNALKYAAGGRITVYARGESLVVEDDGIGIAPEDVPRVFEKGFTGYNGRADTKATGIGLYLTKRVLTRLGHAITLESEQGRGTRAIVELSQKTHRFE